MMEVVLPNDANPLGNILGGKVMHLMDMAGNHVSHTIPLDDLMKRRLRITNQDGKQPGRSV